MNCDNHTGGTEIRNAKEATCTEDGYTGDTYCASCGAGLSYGDLITRLGHIDEDKNHVCDRENCKQTLSDHTGGTATCKDKAVCDYCGEAYGDRDASNHTGMKHTDAKAATTEGEGHTEYWHCEDCGKYFSDEDGKNEITLADTVIPKLEKADNPRTGDESHLSLWLALLFVSGGALAAMATYEKKREHSVK